MGKVKSTKSDLKDLDARAVKLAREKSYLQLVISLMEKVSEAPGLENTIDALLKNILDVLGGDNLILYYTIDNETFSWDVYGKKMKLSAIDDPAVKKVFKTHAPAEIKHSFRDTKLTTPDFINAFTWIYPLTVGREIIGVLKMENILGEPGLLRQLSAFFSFTASVLKNEIFGHTRLQQAYNQLHQANAEISKAKDELEQRVQERTRELCAANEQLEKEYAVRVQAEAKLREQYSTLSGIVESADIIVFSIDMKYRYTSFNSRHAGIMKAIYGAEIQLGHSLLEYFTVPEDREIAKRNLDRALTGEHLVEEAFSGEEERSRLFFHVSHSPIKTADGTVIGAAMVAQDFTEWKRAEVMVTQSEARLRVLSDKGNVGITMYDRDGTLMYYSQSCERITGYSREDRQHLKMEDWIHPSDLETVKEVGQAIMKMPGEVCTFEIQMRRKTGEWIWVEFTSQNLLDDPNVQAFVTSFRDVTERKNMEETTKKLAAIVQSSDDAIIGKTLDGVITSWNHGAEDIYGYSKEEVLGKSIVLLMPPGREVDLQKILDTIRSGKSLERFEAVRRRKDGKDIYMSLKISPVYDEKGKIVAASTIGHDITEKKAAEEALKRLNRELHAISNCNQILLRAEDEEQLNKDICRIVCNEAGYRMAWVGYAENDDHKTIRPVAWAGHEAGYLTNSNISWADNEYGRGPSGSAIRNGEISCIQDFTKESTFLPWRKPALERGYHSSIALPLKDESGSAFGVLCIYAGEINAFNSSELRLLEELAEDLAFGISTLRIRAKKKQAEENLKKAETKYRSLVEQIPAVTYVAGLDPSNKTYYISPQVEEMLGYAVNEWMEDENLWGKCLHRDDAERVLAEVASIRSGGGPLRSEYRMVARDGHTVWVVDDADVVLDETGHPLFLQGVMFDITDRKRLEQELIERSRYSRSLIEANLDPLVMISPEGKITDVNQATEHVTGVPRKELIGKDFCDYFTEPEKARSGYQQVLEKGFVRDFPLTIRHLSGRMTDVLYNYSVYHNDAGEVQGVFAAARDITELKKAEEIILHSELELVEAQRVGRFGNWDWDATTDTITWSKEYYHIYGFDPTQSPPGYVEHLKVYAPESAARLDAAVKRSMELGEPYELDLEFMRADGTTRWVTARCEIKRDNNGKIVGLQGTAQDITERKLAEKALEKRGHQLAEAQHLGHIGSWEWDTTTNNTECSDELFRIMGREPQSFVFSFEAFIECIHPDDRAAVQQQIRHSLETNQPNDIEFRIVTPNNDIRWIHGIGRVVSDDNGKATGMVGIAQDVTDRKLAEESLRTSEKKYRTIFDTTPVGIYQSTREGRFLTANNALVKILGYASVDELLQCDMGTDIYYRKEERDKVIREYEPKGSVANLELQWKKKDRSPVWVQLNAFAVKKADGSFLHFEGYVIDITERKQAEATLRKLERATEQSPASIVITNVKGNIEYVNPKFSSLTGYSFDEVKGRNPRFLKSGDKTREEYKQLWDTILAGGEWRGEFHNKKKDGTLFWEAATISPIKDSDGNITDFVAIKEDIMERKRAEEELKQTEAKRYQLQMELIQSQKLESLGTLASGVAHDFNNILGIILGHASLLKRKQLDPARISDGIDAIQKATLRGASLVKQLLTIARKGESVFESVSINMLVQELIKLLNETFPKTIAVTTTLEPNLPSITADPTQIHQVLLNLCVNARDAMPEGGTLTIVTTTIGHETIVKEFPRATAQEYLYVTVTDTGTGMNEDTKRRIFEPFYTTKGPGKGTGLGLALVYSIIEVHHGMITVESAPGRGTSFRLFLPVEEHDIEMPKMVDTELSEVPGGTETVLVIEDEKMLSEMIESILTAKGYKVLSAFDGAQGIEMYANNQNTIDVVISDLGLPKLSGYDVVQRIQAINPRTKIIIASGYIDPSTRLKLQEKDVHQIIQKPYMPREVLCTIREVLDKKEK